MYPVYVVTGNLSTAAIPGIQSGQIWREKKGYFHRFGGKRIAIFIDLAGKEWLFSYSNLSEKLI